MTRRIVRAIFWIAIITFFAIAGSAAELQSPGWMYFVPPAAIIAILLTIALLRRQTIGPR